MLATLENEKTRKRNKISFQLDYNDVFSCCYKSIIYHLQIPYMNLSIMQGAMRRERMSYQHSNNISLKSKWTVTC